MTRYPFKNFGTLSFARRYAFAKEVFNNGRFIETL